MSQSEKSMMNVLVVGATGGSGQAIVKELLKSGHKVTAFSRNASKFPLAAPRLTKIDGDVTNQSHIDEAVKGHDAVVVTLGISENPIRVRMLGPARTPLNVRSEGTAKVIRAMEKAGIHRLLVQSSYGVGPSRSSLRFMDKLVFGLLLKPQIADTEVQEQAVHNSKLDWTLIQPVHLTDGEDDVEPYFSTKSAVKNWTISRRTVARFIGQSALSKQFVGKTIALSGAGA